MSEKNTIQQVLKVINTGKKYPALQLVKSNPEVAALISKLVKSPKDREFDLNTKDSIYNLNQSQINSISDSTKQRLKDNENVISLFPDIELAIQIIISSILSPKDMVKTEIIYGAKEPILPSEVIMKLNSIASKHIESHYDFKNELSDILRETLFTTGSYVKAVIPESIVDELINSNTPNVSTESISELFIDDKPVSLGILGNSKKGENTAKSYSFESYFKTQSIKDYNSSIVTEDNKALDFIEVTDNYKLLKLPKLIETHNKSKLRNMFKKDARVTMESKSEGLTNKEFSSVVFKESKNNTDTFVAIPNSYNVKRKAIGRPLVIKLPSESVIPVYIPGDESKHIGYFVLLDADGNPLSASSNRDAIEGLSGIMNANNSQSQSLSSMLITKAKNNLVNKSHEITLDQVTKVYSNIVENDLIERLRNGIYGNNVSISNNEEIYRIMLARSFASKYTRIVYIPSELITYFAFKYYNNGIGKSYLDDIKILTSLRAILLFSKVMAMTKSSISISHVDMTLDPKDPDPQKTIEIATNDIVKMRQQYFPLGINSPVDLVDWIQRAGFEFSFTGHPRLPDTKFDFSTKNLQHIVPDNDLDELLRKQTYMAFGLSPEVVDNGFNAEFATTVISNNILLSKRISQLQQVFSTDMSDYGRKLLVNDSIVFSELLTAVKDNKGIIDKVLTDKDKELLSTNENALLEDIVYSYIDNLTLDLPKPDITSIETQISAFDSYKEALEKTIDAWISSEFITSDIAGQINGNIDSVKAVVKSYFLRRWMSENGFMGELHDIVTTTEDGDPTLDIYEINKTHMEGIIHSCLTFINKMQPAKNASDADLTNMNVGEGEQTSNDYNNDSDNESGNDSESDLGEGDLDNLDSLTGDMENLDKTSNEEPNPEDENSEESKQEEPAEKPDETKTE